MGQLNITTVARKFATTESVVSANVGEHLLAVPGKHEALSLSGDCPQCGENTPPASVLDVVCHARTGHRLGTYRCMSCQAAWLRYWGPAL